MEENKLLNTISDPDKVEKDLADSAFDQDWPDDEEISTINRMKSEWDEIETAKEDGVEAQLQGKIKDMHEALEDNEDLVECQNCFDLFPKSECVKVDYGYLCPHCKEIHIIEVPVELVDDATFNLDFDEPEDWYVDEADEISEPVSAVSIDTPVEGEEVIDAPAPEGVTFDLSNGSGAPEEVTVKAGEIISTGSDDSSDSGAENIGDKDVEVFLQSTQENKTLHENYKIIETGIDGDSLVKEGDIVKGVGEIKGEENGEEYYDSIEFEYQPEIDSVKITKINPIFSAAEIAEAEEDLLDNLKTNFQESLKEEKETEEVPEAHEGQMEFLVKDEDEAIEGYDKVIEKTDNEHLAGELEHIKDEEIAHKEFLEIAKENPDATYEHAEEEEVDESLKEEAANVDHYELHFKNPEDEKAFGGLDQFKSKDDAYAKSLEYLDGGHPCEIKKLICNGDICSLVDLDEPNRVNEKLEEKAMANTPFDSEVKVGDKIRIIHLEGEDNSYDGKEGEVEHIDGIGQLHGTWGGLAVIPGVDEFEIITEGLNESRKSSVKYQQVRPYLTKADFDHGNYDICEEDDDGSYFDDLVKSNNYYAVVLGKFSCLYGGAGYDYDEEHDDHFTPVKVWPSTLDASHLNESLNEEAISQEPRGLETIVLAKEFTLSDTVICIKGDKAGAKMPVTVYIKPFTASGDAGNNINKVFVGHLNGKTDYTCYFNDESEAMHFLEQCLAICPEDITNLHMARADKNTAGYAIVKTEFGDAGIIIQKEIPTPIDTVIAHYKKEESLEEEAASVDHYELHFKNPEDEKTFGGLDQFKTKDEAYAKSIEYLDGGHPCEIKKLICSGDICSLVDLDEPNRVNEKLEEKAMVEPAFDSEAKVGDKIKIIHLEGEDNSYDGREGEVEHIDGIGQLHGTWGGLAVIPGVDEFEIINESLKEEAKDNKVYLDAIEAGYQYKDKDGNIYTMYGDEVEEDRSGISYKWDTAEDDDSEFGLEKIYFIESLTESRKSSVKYQQVRAYLTKADFDRGYDDLCEEDDDGSYFDDLVKSNKYYAVVLGKFSCQYGGAGYDYDEEHDDHFTPIKVWPNTLDTTHLKESLKEDYDSFVAVKDKLENYLINDLGLDVADDSEAERPVIIIEVYSDKNKIPGRVDELIDEWFEKNNINIDYSYGFGDDEDFFEIQLYYNETNENLKEANYSATATHTEEVGLGTFEAEDEDDAQEKAEMLYNDGTFDSYWDTTDFEVEKVDENLKEDYYSATAFHNEEIGLGIIEANDEDEARRKAEEIYSNETFNSYRDTTNIKLAKIGAGLKEATNQNEKIFKFLDDFFIDLVDFVIDNAKDYAREEVEKIAADIDSFVEEQEANGAIGTIGCSKEEFKNGVIAWLKDRGYLNESLNEKAEPSLVMGPPADPDIPAAPEIAKVISELKMGAGKELNSWLSIWSPKEFDGDENHSCTVEIIELPTGEYKVLLSGLLVTDDEVSTIFPKEVKAEEIIKYVEDNASKVWHANKLHENLDEASSAEKRAFRNGGKDYDDYIQGKAIARIKDPEAKAAAIELAKAGNKNVSRFTGGVDGRKDQQAVAAFDKKEKAMQDAGYAQDESLEHTVPQDLSDDRFPGWTEKGELGEPVSMIDTARGREIASREESLKEGADEIPNFIVETIDLESSDSNDEIFDTEEEALEWFDSEVEDCKTRDGIWEVRIWSKEAETYIKEWDNEVDESLKEDADVDYVEYMHSYCNALEPHMDELRKIEDVEELKKAILDIVNEDPDVNATKKKNKFVWLIKNKKWSSTKNIMAYLDKAMEKAKSIEVKVDDQGELVKEELEDEETEVCAWCGEEYPVSDLHKEVDLGYLCSSCEQAIKSRGEKLTFEE